MNQEVKVIWSEDLTYIESFVINGHYLSPSRIPGINIFDKINNINRLTNNQQLLEDLFVFVTVLRAKILSKHCHY